MDEPPFQNMSKSLSSSIRFHSNRTEIRPELTQMQSSEK